MLAHVADIGGSKAYAPLVYSVPVGASPVIGDQYKNDTPLPKYREYDIGQCDGGHEGKQGWMAQLTEIDDAYTDDM